MIDSRDMPARLALDRAQQVQRVGVFRLGLQNLPAHALGIVEPAGAMECDGLLQ
jgi:hypothetical protein